MNNENESLPIVLLHAVIGYWHHTIVCLSVCLRHCALWLNDTSYSKTVRTSK